VVEAEQLQDCRVSGFFAVEDWGTVLLMRSDRGPRMAPEKHAMRPLCRHPPFGQVSLSATYLGYRTRSRYRVVLDGFEGRRIRSTSQGSTSVSKP
jgi:hypothetical protein